MATDNYTGPIDALVVLTHRDCDQQMIYRLEDVSLQEEMNRSDVDQPWNSMRCCVAPLGKPHYTLTIDGDEMRGLLTDGATLPEAMSKVMSEVYKERDEAKREAGELRQRVYRLENAMRDALELASSILDPEDRDDTECFDSDY